MQFPRITMRRAFAVTAVGLATVLAVPSSPVASAPPPRPAIAAHQPQPDVVPQPTTNTAAMNSRTAWALVKYNRLYRTGQLAASKCREPRYPLNSAANVRAYHLSFLHCLNTVWYFKMRAAKYRFYKPTLVVHNGINTRCGYISTSRAVYCAATRGIYIPWKRYANLWSRNSLYVRTWAASVIAHEYGHHVQQMSGILPAFNYRYRYVLRTTAARLEENRRMELQATCMSAVYLGADRVYFPVSGAWYRQWAWLVKNIGDQNNPPGAPRTHGNGKSNNYWSTRGFNYKSAYSCMTWSSSSATVA